MTVGLVIVSHSEKIAEGVLELARQMAGSIRIVAAGGTDDGGIGTSFDKISTGIASADDGGGVVLLCDLGSAILTAETALDLLDAEVRDRVRIAKAPLVEGAVSAAVAAEIGGDLATVVEAAESAGRREESAPPVPPETGGATHSAATATTTLVNDDGLHARPASEFVKLASTFEASVRVNGVDAKSLLRIMSLGLAKGREVTIVAEGPDAGAAVDALVELIGSGFGE